MRLLLVLVIGILCAPALAQDVPTVAERLERAKAAEANLEYQVAADELLEALSDPSATQPELLAANLHAGIVHRILDKNVEARLHFVYVFQRDRDAQLPAGQPPKIVSFFNLVRQEVVGARRAEPAAAPSTAPTKKASSQIAPGVGTRRALPAGKVRAVKRGGPGPLVWTGAAVAATAALVAGVAGATALAAESIVGDVNLPTDERAQWQQLGVGSALAAGVAGLVALVGVGVLAAGFVVE